MLATLKGYADIVRTLLEGKADPNIIDKVILFCFLSLCVQMMNWLLNSHSIRALVIVLSFSLPNKATWKSLKCLSEVELN